MKLSIITVNYNNAIGLKKTIDSVFMQTNAVVEYVVIDGASSDNSVAIIKSFEQKTPIELKFIWISERDNGIYHAMNKGISMASGEYLLFLNSGDMLQNNGVIDNFNNSVIFADIASGIEMFDNGLIKKPPEEKNLTYSFFYNDTLMHQSTFIKRSAFKQFGNYREDYCIVSDWEWFFRTIVRDGATYQALNFVIAVFDGSGISRDINAIQLHNYERMLVRKEILPRIYGDYKELMYLREIKNEYDNLTNGRLGFIVKFIVKLKCIKKRII